MKMQLTEKQQEILHSVEEQIEKIKERYGKIYMGTKDTGEDWALRVTRKKRPGKQAGNVVYASVGKEIFADIHDTPRALANAIVQEKLRVMDVVTQNELFHDLPGLLSDPFIDIAKYFGAYTEMLDDIRTTGENLPTGVPARLDITRLFSGITSLQFDRNHSGTIEHLADVGIHEKGHILSNFKSLLFAYGFDETELLQI